MKVLHGTWIPEQTLEYRQSGAFYLWVETITSNRGKRAKNAHPRALKQNKLEEFLKDELGVKDVRLRLGVHQVADKDEYYQKVNQKISTKYFTLPSLKNAPLKSYELMRYSGEDIPQKFQLQPWGVYSYEVSTVNLIKLLNDIHFLFSYQSSETLLGADILFWYHYTQSLKGIILKDQYIPSLKYRELPRPEDKRKKKYDKFQIHPGWEIVSEKYEAEIQKYISFMPQVCVAGSSQLRENGHFFSKETLLRHFSENLLNRVVSNTQFPATFDKQISDSLLYHCIYPSGNGGRNFWRTEKSLEGYKKWCLWRRKLLAHQLTSQFILYRNYGRHISLVFTGFFCLKGCHLLAISV